MANNVLNNTTSDSIAIFLRSNEAEIDVSTTHKKFYLSELISVNPDVNIIVGITDFTCPYSFYTIREGINNQITLGFNTASYPLGEFRTSYIPTGNYDIDELIVALNALTCFIDANIAITYSNLTNKLTLIRSGLYNTFCFTVSTTCGTELGIPQSLLINIGLGVVLNLTSPYILPDVFNLSGASCVYIKINNLGIKNLNSKGDSDGTLCKVPVDVMPNEYIFYRPAEYFYFTTTKSQIRELDIEILDDYYRPINLNGGIFSMTLSLQFSYKKIMRFTREYYLIKPNNLSTEIPKEEEVKENNI